MDILELNKSELIHKILNLIVLFNQFNKNNNQIFILRSLNYIKEVLRKETFDNNIKHDFLELIQKYVDELDRIYFRINNNGNVLENINMYDIKLLFKRLKSYVFYELNTNMHICYEKDLYYEYEAIKNFIFNEIISKHEFLLSCDLKFLDEIGNPAFEYYIKYCGNLSFENIQNLTHNVFNEVYGFCLDSNFEDVFRTISIFIVKEE